MQFTVTKLQSNIGVAAVVCIVLSGMVALSDKASAGDNPFIDQASKGGSNSRGSYSPTLSTTLAPTTSFVPHSGSTPLTPENAAMTGGNVATTLEMGQFNHVFQAQAGSGNVSNVGVIKGINNNVGVLQAGHSLSSNLLLINTQGISVGVIQPNGSAPVNMMIARLPNGGLLIKR